MRETIIPFCFRMCSTPFGIIGIRTSASAEVAGVWSRCSTPFGIIGIRTCGRRLSRFVFACAQRLSASSEFAPLLRKPPSRAIQCAQRLSASSEFAQMPDRRRCNSDSCAQRLSASSEFALLLTLGGSLRTACAQRLSASSEFAHPKVGSPTRRNDVLNAFRHHRNSHFSPLLKEVLCQQVLNAFRHHRNSHTILLYHHLPVTLCSTPFGIIGIRTIRSLTADAGPTSAQRLSASSEFALVVATVPTADREVLNAFRHHRYSHTHTS